LSLLLPSLGLFIPWTFLVGSYSTTRPMSGSGKPLSYNRTGCG